MVAYEVVRSAVALIINFWREILIGILLIIIVSKDANYSKLQTEFSKAELVWAEKNLEFVTETNRELVKAFDKLNETERRLSGIAADLVNKEAKVTTITETKYRELQPIINNLTDGCFTDDWLLKQNQTISAYSNSNPLSED